MSDLTNKFIKLDQEEKQ